LDFLHETVSFVRLWILKCVASEKDYESSAAAEWLTPQDSAHALDHLTAGPACTDDDAEIGVGHINSLVQNTRCGYSVDCPNPKLVKDSFSFTTARFPCDDFNIQKRI
jgi:hypothetical protein